MSKRSNDSSNGRSSRPLGWKTALSELLKDKGKLASDGGRIISFATRRARRDNLFIALNDIRNELNFKFQKLDNLSPKHIYALAKLYKKRLQEKSISDATIRNRFSHLRLLFSWLGKNGMMKDTDHYFKGIKVRRLFVARESKTWSDKGIDPYQKITLIRKKDDDNYQRVAFALELQLLFGLRTKESLLLMPHLDDRGHVLHIRRGAKGGRERFIVIENEKQRELLDRLKKFVPINESLIPKEKSSINFLRKYYRILKQHGISRKDGITAHGLRHEHLNALYEQVTGHKSPIRGGNLAKIDKARHKLGIKAVMYESGHRSEAISPSYIGSNRITSDANFSKTSKDDN